MRKPVGGAKRGDGNATADRTKRRGGVLEKRDNLILRLANLGKHKIRGGHKKGNRIRRNEEENIFKRKEISQEKSRGHTKNP